MAEFNEAEHPRDADGKFTVKGKSLRKQALSVLRKKLIKIDLQFFTEQALEHQTLSQLLKGIRNLNKEISKHEDKINHPENKYPGWHTFSEEKQQGIIIHWQNELNAFKESVKNRENEIKKRNKK